MQPPGLPLLIRIRMKAAKIHPVVRAKYFRPGGTIHKALTVFESDPFAPGRSAFETYRLSRLQIGLSKPGDASAYSSRRRFARSVYVKEYRSSMGDRALGEGRLVRIGLGEALLNSLSEAAATDSMRGQIRVVGRIVRDIKERMKQIEADIRRPRGRPSQPFDFELWDCLDFAFKQCYSHGPKSPKGPMSSGVLPVRRVFLRIIYAFVYRCHGEPDLGDPRWKNVRRGVFKLFKLAEPCLFAFETSNRALQMSDDKAVRDYVDNARSSCALGPREATNYVMAKWATVNRDTVLKAWVKRKSEREAAEAEFHDSEWEALCKVNGDGASTSPIVEGLGETLVRLGWARRF